MLVVDGLKAHKRATSQFAWAANPRSGNSVRGVAVCEDVISIGVVSEVVVCGAWFVAPWCVWLCFLGLQFLRLWF